MTDLQKLELLAISDFLDWLVDHGYVVAKRDDVHLWTPITLRDAEAMCEKFLEAHQP